MADQVRKPQLLLICLMLALVTFAVYWQVTDHGFVNYDDPQYVTDNLRVRAGLTFQGVRWAFTTFQAGNWHPLTWLSHMLDCQVFGLRPAGHHMVSLLFHVANTLLLFFILLRMTQALRESAFVAALFALHPLHVESVAWIAERKDVLSAFFWMLTMWAYVRYVERPGILRYILAIVFSLLGLLSKPMLVTLPFVLLLLDYWPLGRLGPTGLVVDTVPVSAQGSRKKKQRANKGSSQNAVQHKKFGISIRQRWSSVRFLVLEKVPLFVLSAFSSIITYYAQQKSGAMATFDFMPIENRLENTLISYTKYIGKLFWPENLAVIYPYPVKQPLWPVFGAALILVTITVLSVRAIKEYPYVAIGWFWFLGTLVPVIGFVQVGIQAMADRYTYVPFIGLFIALTWGTSELLRKRHFPNAMFAVLAIVILFSSAIVTFRQLRYWRDSVMLFSHAANIIKNNDIAQNYLGMALRKEGRIEEAVRHYMEAIRINPHYGDGHNNLAHVLFIEGKLAEAEFHVREALRISPNETYYLYNMAMILLSQNKKREAASYLQAVLRIDPNFIAAHFSLGNLMASQGMFSEAVAHYEEVIHLDPNNGKIHHNIGNALLAMGKIDDAIVHFQAALRIEPDLVLAQKNLRRALELKGETYHPENALQGRTASQKP